MKRRIYLISLSAIVSGLALAGSSCGRDADVRHLPPPPERLATDQRTQPRPVMSEAAATSEAAYEAWVSDMLDWGERRNGVAWRWCQLYNEFATTPVDCGAKPAE